MAAKSFTCKLITPESKVFDLPATTAVLPLWDGQMGILANRAPLVAKLGVGELRVDFADASGPQGASKSFYVEDGFARMAQNTLTILASKAIPAGELDEAAAQAEAAEADARRTEDVTDRVQLERIRRDRARSKTKLRIARSIRSKSR